MKKVFLALLVAGLFVACGNKNTEAENTDSTAMETEVIEEATEAPAAEPAAEPVAETQAQPTEKEQTVGQVAKEEGDKLAKEAIKAGAQAGSEELKNVATPSQTR